VGEGQKTPWKKTKEGIDLNKKKKERRGDHLQERKGQPSYETN